MLPFLKLPDVVQRNVFKRAEFRDLFVLTLSSKRVCKLVKNAKIRVQETHLELNGAITLYVIVNGQHIDLKFGGHAFIQNQQFPFEKKTARFGKMVLPYYYSRDLPNNFYFNITPHYKALHFISDFVSNIFLFDHYSFLSVGGYFTEDVEKYVEGIDVNKIIVTEPKVKAQNLDLVLKEINLREEILFSGAIDEPVYEFSSTKIWDLPIFSSQKDALCLTDTQFLRLNCNHINMHKSSLSADGVISWIRKWLDGTDNKLRSLAVTLDKEGPRCDPEEVFSQFEILEWNPRTRDQYYKWEGEGLYQTKKGELFKHKDCQYGRDILRKDGLLATIVLTKWKFEMYVWHHRFADDFN